MTGAFLTATVVVLNGSWPAYADCPAPSTLDTTLSRCTAIDEALAAERFLSARDEARRLREEVPCLVEPIPDGETAATIARGIGSGYVASGEMALGKPWLRTAIDLDEDYVWTLPDGHPVMEVWRTLQDEPTPPIEAYADDGLRGQARLDGEPLDVAEARLDRPHLFQLGEEPTKTWIIFGNRFPEEALGRRSSSRRARKSRPEEVPESTPRYDQPLVLDRVRPPEKTPLIASGTAMVVLAGGLYGLAAQRRSVFEDETVAQTEGEVARLRNQVNGLVIGSAAAFALGAGGITWGTLVDARGASRVRLRL